MPNIQVVVKHNKGYKQMSALYIGYSYKKAQETYLLALNKSVRGEEIEWYETDEDTEIDLEKGEE